MRLTWQHQLAESAYDEFLSLLRRKKTDPALLDLSAGYDLVTKISAKGFGKDRRLPITNRWREHA